MERAQRDREYRAASFQITEALRFGVITRHEAFVRIRAAYVAIYGAAHSPAQPVNTTTTERNPK